MDISSLPSSIIDNILVRLPLEEIVRTSILSRAWRYKWTSVPELSFDCLLDRTYEPEIYQILHQHQGPLHKFYLTFIASPCIDQWIMLLPSCQIQDFKLEILGGGKHEIQSHFFAFQNLKHLYLQKCIFKPPAEFKGFSKLATLHFEDVDCVPAILEQLISQSPLLEKLKFERCTLDAFEVQGPSLKIFSFNGTFKTICFKNSPVLADVKLCMPISEIPSFTGFKYFQIPPTVEKLILYPCVLEVMGAGGVPSRFADSLNALKVLTLTLYLNSVKEVASALCLARSSPNLQMLSITLYGVAADKAVIEFMRAQETPDPYLHQLKRVEIPFFCEAVPQFELIKYLLASAAGLEEMVITTYSFVADGVMNWLQQCPRASPTAVVVLNERG